MDFVSLQLKRAFSREKPHTHKVLIRVPIVEGFTSKLESWKRHYRVKYTREQGAIAERNDKIN